MSETTNDRPGDRPENDKRGEIGEKVQELGAKVGEAARHQATAAAQAPKAAGIETVEGISRAVHKAADEIDRESPAVAGYVRDAASNIDKVAKGLREHSVGELIEMATQFGRQQPVAFFAGAMVLGFALSRFVKSGMHEATPPAETAPSRHEISRIGE